MDKRRSRFRPEFAKDLDRALAYYTDLGPALVERFRAAVADSVRAIGDRSESYPSVLDDLRACRVSGFQYLILFSLDGDQVLIGRLVHGASDPNRWDRRSGGD